MDVELRIRRGFLGDGWVSDSFLKLYGRSEVLNWANRRINIVNDFTKSFNALSHNASVSRFQRFDLAAHVNCGT